MCYASEDVGLQSALFDEFCTYRTLKKTTFQLPTANEQIRLQAIKSWEMFGFCTPNLRRIAIHVLSQGTCASPCERNLSTFSLIHTKRRNRLTHAHVEKLVYIHANHRLIRRFKERRELFPQGSYMGYDKQGK